jgi:hypothetical protein
MPSSIQAFHAGQSDFTEADGFPSSLEGEHVYIKESTPRFF